MSSKLFLTHDKPLFTLSGRAFIRWAYWAEGVWVDRFSSQNVWKIAYPLWVPSKGGTGTASNFSCLAGSAVATC